MPPQSRAQRRRQSQRASGRPARPAPARTPVAEEQESIEMPAPTLATASATAAARQQRQTRRSVTRAPEPVDYSKDYASARHDLIRLTIISAVLFVGMIALGFSGLL